MSKVFVKISEHDHSLDETCFCFSMSNELGDDLGYEYSSDEEYENNDAFELARDYVHSHWALSTVVCDKDGEIKEFPPKGL